MLRFPVDKDELTVKRIIGLKGDSTYIDDKKGEMNMCGSRIGFFHNMLKFSCDFFSFAWDEFIGFLWYRLWSMHSKLFFCKWEECQVLWNITLQMYSPVVNQVQFYFVLFILFYFILFYFILFYFILFYFRRERKVLFLNIHSFSSITLHLQ